MCVCDLPCPVTEKGYICAAFPLSPSAHACVCEPVAWSFARVCVHSVYIKFVCAPTPPLTPSSLCAPLCKSRASNFALADSLLLSRSLSRRLLFVFCCCTVFFLFHFSFDFFLHCTKSCHLYALHASFLSIFEIHATVLSLNLTPSTQQQIFSLYTLAGAAAAACNCF